ncbi:MAG: aminopeptidase [Deltaproteobacteria bacterium]|nr:aminopeptidase [Deltaproteobacteria bacterium]
MKGKRIRRYATMVLGAGAMLTALLALSPNTTVGYLTRQGYFQVELLAGRVPLEEARASAGYRDAQLTRLDWIREIQAFGDDLGLASGDSYTTINPSWKRTIYNVSACQRLAFRPVRWHFPIVGRVPYLGFFRREDALQRREALEAQGYDTYVRKAGAYSTLGWFRDPVLPHMLAWPEGTLANTLLHERAHATLWVPGSVRFNESFANFVGNEAQLRYLASTYGEDSDEVGEERRRREDRAHYRTLLHEIYAALDALYGDPERSQGEKLRDKGLVLAAIPTRVAALHLHHHEKYMQAVRRGPWNNARLVQFRTYHTSHEQFALLLEQEGGALVAFIERVEAICRGANNPYAALAAATGFEPPPEDSVENF